jgi:hypothetical protein
MTAEIKACKVPAVSADKVDVTPPRRSSMMMINQVSGDLAGISQQEKECRERTALLAICRHAAGTYSAKRAEIEEQISMSFEAEYEALYQLADDAKDTVISARNNLKRHVAEHGC